MYSSFSPCGRLTTGLAVTVSGAGKCDRGVCVKFLSWGTRLHISPSFLEATANFTHPYLAPFRWQGACFCMGRRHWAICHAQRRSAREMLLRVSPCSEDVGVALLLFPWQRLALLQSCSRCGRTGFRPCPLRARAIFPLPHAPDCFPAVKKLVKSEGWRGVLINEA